MPKFPLIISLLGSAAVGNAFVIPSKIFSPIKLEQETPTTALFMAKTKKGKKKSKGFAKVQENTDKGLKSDNELVGDDETATNFASTINKPSSAATAPTRNAGEEALSRLRRQKAEQRDEELRAIRDMKSVDEYIASEPDAAVIPEQVAQRMGRRMLPFVGIPLFGVMGTFIVFWYLATYRNLEFQPALVAFSTIGVLGVSLLGITYSVMSASWDPEVEGSLIGAEEFKTNLGNIQDGLKRSRENAILRDKMAGLPEAEIQRAIRDLDKRDAKAKKSKMSMDEKMDSEME
eukprot:CAMPEP_0203642932 /NCGR_PEP_ID=MMETSP0088-20131115/8354_1 /ASSEMBLY_ACC=CAM_ASM_001087 /TAXON_ID=426623 /ORGANISM="Chaetoceros affinis, Strain CCMP159" /LENGTH=289 /DNA_ID=CAMNT_0050498929 /DNA_START=1 /DNA_END=870 /DNA_ORIENTATION=+